MTHRLNHCRLLALAGLMPLVAACGLMASEESTEEVATETTFLQRLVAPTPEEFEQFGHALDLDGDLIVVGARGSDRAGEDAGAVYVYSFDGGGWSLEASLEPPNPVPAAQFGYSVAVASNILAVGTPFYSNGGDRTGAVYLFERTQDGWEQVQVLTGDGNSSYFGSALAMNDTTLAVSEPGSIPSSLHVYERSDGEWRIMEVIESNDPAGRFGAIEIDNDILAVSEFNDASSRSKVTLYRIANAIATAEQVLTSPVLGDRFGEEIELRTDRLVVSAPADATVYAYDRPGPDWLLAAELSSPLTPPGRFGASLALWGANLLVGVPNYDAGTGVVVRYGEQDGEWLMQELIRPEPATADQAFGASIEATSKHAAIGATGDSTAARMSGAVYTLRLSGGGRGR